MTDPKAEIISYLESVERRTVHAIDLALDRISRSKHVCVFGVGAISYPIIDALRRLTTIHIDFVSDNDPSKWDKVYHGDLRCIPPQELERYRGELAVVITTQHYAEIREQLRGLGIEDVYVVTEYRLLNRSFFKEPGCIASIQRNVARLCDILADERSKEILSVLIENWFDFDVDAPGYRPILTEDQYYPPDIINLHDHEAFVDGGAYDGDTIVDFVRRTAGRFDAAHGFELDAGNFETLRAAVNGLPQPARDKIELYDVGLWDEEREIGYETGGSGSQSSCIDAGSSASRTGRVKPLSSVLGDRPVTFIKMDIEGAEPAALRGAEPILVRQKPKLAICVYHRPQHLWEIPLYIKRVVPEYRIYLRHHTPMEYETVCYAVPG